jgi:hypothetical protein
MRLLRKFYRKAAEVLGTYSVCGKIAGRVFLWNASSGECEVAADTENGALWGA